ncbi:MAG: ABC transporter ATP-binding protein [Oceanospirillaceae bacterium]|nr:ABC transporter ATP-binding protein [Oceanospirillaceae bacterium]MBT13336.1 ABC transporter ATP-binding protein [Oceanospirillaceae bacterium]|tara:strand:- start:17232 stop:18155 length:924 start_codon:yes stop_codon:yes gene_type:complete
MIEVERLTRRFGDFTAVDDLSFEVRPGEVLGFLGPNGAGKSTTMKMLTGFLPPTSGRVSLFGLDIARQPLAVKQRLGYLPEGAPAWSDMTVLGFLKFIADVRGLKGKNRSQRIMHAAALTGLEPVLKQNIGTLSKGFKRRVGLAQTLLHDPDVLILDEPTDGLDPNQKQQVRDLISQLAEDKIVIISTHILEEVSAVCSRAMIIAAGRKVADGTPAELEARSRYHQAVSVQFSEPVQAASVFAGLPGVMEVDEYDGGRGYRIFPEEKTSVFHAVNTAIETHHWPLDTLHIERGRLEDVFRQLTEGKS